MGPQREGCPAGSAGCPMRPPGWHPIPVPPGSPRQPLSPEAEPHYPGAWGQGQTQNAHFAVRAQCPGSASQTKV